MVAGVIFVTLALVVFVVLTSGKNGSTDEKTNTDLVAEEEAPTNRTNPSISDVQANLQSVGLFEMLELTIGLEADYENPYDPKQVDLFAEFVSPTGKPWKINGFYDGESWRLRFSPDELGEWSYKLLVQDRVGKYSGADGKFAVTATGHPGWIQLSESNKRFLEYRNGQSFYGINLAYPWGITDFTLDRVAQNGVNLLTYWNGNYDNSGGGGGKNQLESKIAGIGQYDIRKANRIDELLVSFEDRDLHMNFVIWPHDSLADQIPGWPSTWKMSAYSALGEAVDFYEDQQMWEYQEKLYRYIIARWGHSRALGIWDIICEINGTDGWSFGREAAANAWAKKTHDFFKENDPYGHPTMGSMAGGQGDYWDFGYKTFDLADRENYYDLHFSAYAEDIQKRWNSYEKPIIIGETGNVTDVNLYHHAAWVSLVNGLASAPTWWDITKVNDEMLSQMKSLAAFVKQIDFLEPRVPVIAETSNMEKKLDASIIFEDGQSIDDWSIPEWAEANKDAKGTRSKIQLTEDSDHSVVSADLWFATGTFSQGVMLQTAPVTDWSSYDQLTMDVYVGDTNVSGLRAVPVVFPEGQWNEVAESNSTALQPGQWTKVVIPFSSALEKYWRNIAMIPEDYEKITQWGLKVYTGNSPSEWNPTTISIRNVKLESSRAPVVTVKEAEAWVMQGDKLSYGWTVSEHRDLAGIQVKLPNWQPGSYLVRWYDTWDGVYLTESSVQSVDGTLLLTAPQTKRTDLAFTIQAE